MSCTESLGIVLEIEPFQLSAYNRNNHAIMVEYTICVYKAFLVECLQSQQPCPNGRIYNLCI